MKSLRIAFASLALLVVAGCSKEPASGGTPAALGKCPTCGQAAVATVATVDYDGKKVGFCCQKCVDAWNGMDAAAKKAAYDKNMK
jgi:endogenous inhibitor of DNA gyrase (YacG/DUF329 family)